MSRLDRQSFLGPQSYAILEAATIGIVGLGGGGSHVAQQTAHMGIGGYVNADPDVIEDTNTNRLVGGTLADVSVKMPKVTIAERLIRGLQPNVRIVSIPADWRGAADDPEEVGLIQRVREHIRAARDAGGRNWCPFSIPLRLGGHGRSLSVIRQ